MKRVRLILFLFFLSVTLGLVVALRKARLFSEVYLRASRISERLDRQEYAHDACFFYDKPYRTGSTTIEQSLCQCWARTFNATDKSQVNQDQRVPEMLNKTARVVVRCVGHVTMSLADADRLTSECQHLFYLSSTRDIQSRMASFGKNDAIYGQIYTNMTLSREQLVNAVHWARSPRGRLEELIYENYPYPHVPREVAYRLEPDYVIRYDNFADDLLKLLEAFQCEGVVQTTNIHALDTEDIPFNNKPGRTRHSTMPNKSTDWDALSMEQLKDELLNTPINLGNKIHLHMLEIAEKSNDKALRLARMLRDKYAVKSQAP